MSKQDFAARIGASKTIANVWTNLVRKVEAQGGSPEDIDRLEKPEGDSILAECARVIIAAGRAESVSVHAATRVVTPAIGDTFRIVVPANRTLEERIKDTSCESVYNELSDADLPESTYGEKEVMMVHPNQYFPNTKTLETWLDERGLCIAAPQDALQFAKDHPELQRQFWYAVFWWDKDGSLCGVILDRGGRRRRVRVNRGVVAFWRDGCRFLVVRKGQHLGS